MRLEEAYDLFEQKVKDSSKELSIPSEERSAFEAPPVIKLRREIFRGVYLLAEAQGIPITETLIDIYSIIYSGTFGVGYAKGKVDLAKKIEESNLVTALKNLKTNGAVLLVS